MVVLSEKDGWKLMGFKKSTKPDKKITAILKNNDKVREIHFGQRGSSTYKDDSGVGGDPTHKDKKRRDSYRARHAGEGDASKKYSAGWLSWHVLWIVFLLR